MLKLRKMVGIALILPMMGGLASAHENGRDHSALSPDHFGIVAVVALIAGLAIAAWMGRGRFQASRKDHKGKH
ncbi:MAG: hypothetical protein AAGC77_00240 [Pseudomonadota bacterium]